MRFSLGSSVEISFFVVLCSDARFLGFRYIEWDL